MDKFFQLGPLPDNIMTGTYDWKLVILSYIIAVLASYVALDIAGRLRAENKSQAKTYWLLGGSFAMGAGIWSMHFIGMLAFKMQMPMGYTFTWTAGSLAVAIIASFFALFLLSNKNRKSLYTILGGILIGLGIATMHYMGMEAMTIHVNIRYIPSIFLLSIAIAIFASEAALWLAMKSNEGTLRKQFKLKVISALIMGIAICGMHYTGMAAAVFTPITNMNMAHEVMEPDVLAFFVAGISAVIITLMLTISTYYKTMINAIQNEKDFLNAMLDNLENGIIACDKIGRITVINDVLLKKINFKKGKFPADLSKNFVLFQENNNLPVPPNEYPLQLAMAGKTIQSKEYLVKFKDGEIRNVIINGQPIISKSGDKLGAVLVVHDVTELKKTDKLKREFVSVVSHELRTPLTSIKGSVSLLLGGAGGTFSEKANTLLEIANKNCERLLLLINDILDMEKIQANKMTLNVNAVNIADLVTDAVNTNKIYGEKYNVTFNLQIDVNPNTYVFTDPARLQQVVTNLISNAAKFSPPHGVVHLYVSENNDTVRIAVHNDGPEIPKDFQPRIFQQFSQADATDTRGKGGTGLGLSISKAIMERLGGTLNFVSNTLEGTTFFAELPIYHSIQKEKQSKREENHSYRILICEHETDKAKYLSNCLQNAGFEVDVANTGAETKEQLQKNVYNVAFLDLSITDQDGIGLVREIRKIYPPKQLPIIVCSLIPENGDDLVNGDAVIVLDWLDNPMNVNKLLEVITSIERNKKELPRILHVEDDADTKVVVQSILENEAIITHATTIQEAIHLMGHDNFDLVILDLLLPDGNAAELLPLFSKYNLPIIVYSAFELDKEYTKYVSQALIKSNISNDKILAIIKNLLQNKTKEKVTS